VNRTIPIASLPVALRVEDAVEAACAADIAFIEERLRRGTSVLVECDKELSLYLYLAVRAAAARTKDAPKLVVIDGRPAPEGPPAATGLAHDGAAHRDRSAGASTAPSSCCCTSTCSPPRTRAHPRGPRVIPLLYENPEAVLLGFRDPSFEMPKVIRGVFGARREITGIPREALPKIITQREARRCTRRTSTPSGCTSTSRGSTPCGCVGSSATSARREARRGDRSLAEVYTEIRKQTVTEDIELPGVDLDATSAATPR
jgi:cell division protease FtsH